MIIGIELSLSCSRQLPGASESFQELPGGAGMLKVIIGIELSLACSRIQELPGSFQELPGSFQEEPEC